MRGYFGIGLFKNKRDTNTGLLLRHCNNFGASFCFTIGKRYTSEVTDTSKTWKHIPLYNYSSFEEFYNNIPYSTKLIGVEISDKATSLIEYKHPERAIYLLGAEDFGLPLNILNSCHEIIQIPSIVSQSMNVGVSGSIIMYDRHIKTNKCK